MHAYLFPQIPWLEKLLRAAMVYGFIMVAFRLLGKRQMGQMTKFDLILLLVIANVLQNAMIGADDSVLGGMVGATTILGLNWIVGAIAMRSKKFEHLVEGEPTPVVFNGRVIERNLRSNQMTREDLMASLRRQGVFQLDEVKLAVIEDNGTVSVLRRIDQSAEGGNGGGKRAG